MIDPAAVNDLIQKAHGHAMRQRRLPESTYRLQFHKGFTFRDGTEIIPYLAELGITHVYASPYLRAAPGSTHGYDVIDHCRLNPEFGAESDFNDFLHSLAEHRMTHILDTVPNHVGIATNENIWWNDVLEHGPASRYGGYFDIAWQDSPRPELRDRVLVPILGQAYAKALEGGQLRLSFDEEKGAFAISYFARTFPINPSSYGQILSRRAIDVDEYQSILTEVANLPSRSDRDPARGLQRRRETAIIKRRLAAMVQRNALVKSAIEFTVRELNGRQGDVHSFDALDDLLSAQCYRLADWHIAPDEINYRRFFDINDLAAMVMEREDVFEETHALTLRLLAEGKVAGLRIDHPDGLYDPERYFERLQWHYLLACAQEVAAADSAYRDIPWAELKAPVLAQLETENFIPPPLYVVAEKILAVDERLPRDWAIAGTSGYQCLSMINELFVDAAGAKPFTRLYGEFIGDQTPFEEVAYRKQRMVLDTAMCSELQMLTHRLGRLAAKNRQSRDFTHHVLREALAEIIACFPVYRTYITGPSIHEVDRARIGTAIRGARERNPKSDADVFAFIGDTLLQKYPDNFTDGDRAEQVIFTGKFQQLTAPVTAKGVEDTAFYIYNRLVSLNEVGGDPARFGIGSETLHSFFAVRQKSWPHGLSAMSTHDTKRSEDVRARLNVLSEMPEEWNTSIQHWQKLNAASGPTANEQYLLYQALLGAWPVDPHSPAEYGEFIKRVQAYMLKAMREAKVTTSWTEPNAEHEKGVADFIQRILSAKAGDPFLTSFRPFQRRIAHLGLLNSLSQTLLKLTCPGVPDTYQGTELWDFSLVDPDNRRPVDYAHRRQTIEELHAMQSSHRENLAGMAEELMRTKEDGRIKFWITWQMLHARRDHPGLFSRGEYIPLKVTGEYSKNIFAFARRHEGRMAIVVVPRLLGKLAAGSKLPLGAGVWADTTVVVPEHLSGDRFRDLFTGNHVTQFRVGEILSHVSVSVLMSDV
jgi:(1->4)-alpha-D-glucan 1-alpha-D-glucosylmutase